MKLRAYVSKKRRSFYMFQLYRDGDLSALYYVPEGYEIHHAIGLIAQGFDIKCYDAHVDAWHEYKNDA